MKNESIDLNSFRVWLRHNESHPETVKKYLRDVCLMLSWLRGRPITKDVLTEWKSYLLGEGYATVTVNSMLAAVNRFLCFLGKENCRVRYVKVQRKAFRDGNRELTREDYSQLLKTAQEKPRLALLLETLAATGVRVSEVKYITVQAAQKGCVEISLKGKVRCILLPNKLCRKLLKFAQKQKITQGEIFLTKSGNSLDRRQIWAELKKLAGNAGVDPKKVFPHNLRHLFAVTFYNVCKDIVKLSDVLGHSSLETTRIYLLTSGREHARLLERMQLVI